MAISPASNTALVKKNRPLTGYFRAALMLMLLDSNASSKIWPLMRDDEIVPICKSLGKIPSITPAVTEALIIHFIQSMSSTTLGLLDMEQTEKILQSALTTERATSLMEEIRGPKGVNVWEKISNIPDTMLAKYLKNEYPQTVAVILSYITAEQASRVMAQLPQKLVVEVLQRMLKMRKPQRDMLSKIEAALNSDLVENIYSSDNNNSHNVIAGIFDNFDKRTANQLFAVLEEDNREAAESIKSLMFTFDDIVRLTDKNIQLLLRHIPRDQLIMALKGANGELRQMFFKNMSERARKSFGEDLEILGAVKLKDVDKAQSSIVSLIKEMADKGEIEISKKEAAEEMLY